MKYALLFLAFCATSAHGQVEVRELEKPVPDDVTVVDCPAVFTVPISLAGEGRYKTSRWSLEDYRCRGYEELAIGGGTLIANRRGRLRLMIHAHLEPSFDRLMRGRIDLLDREKRVLLSEEFWMEIEEGKANEMWLRMGPIPNAQSIASLALAVYSIQED